MSSKLRDLGAISLVMFPTALRPYRERLTTFMVVPLMNEAPPLCPPPLELGIGRPANSIAIVTSTPLSLREIA